MIWLLALPVLVALPVVAALVVTVRGLRHARAPKRLRLIASHIQQQERPALRVVRGGKSR